MKLTETIERIKLKQDYTETFIWLFAPIVFIFLFALFAKWISDKLNARS